MVKKKRRYITMHFQCCNVYRHIVPNRENTAYVGWCPKCMKKAVVRIGPDGMDCRNFICY